MIALHSSSVAYWIPSDLGGSSSTVITLCLLILLMGFLRQEHCSGLPFPSPVDHVVSEPFAMTCLPWVALYSMAHSFIELSRPLLQILSLLPLLPILFAITSWQMGKK